MKMDLLRKYLISRNVRTVGIGMIFVWLAVFGMATMFSSPMETREGFIYITPVVLISFLAASLIIKIISKVINFQSLFKYFEVDLSWIFILALGSFFFICIFVYPRFFAFEAF